jgi:hypothetical protein
MYLLPISSIDKLGQLIQDLSILKNGWEGAAALYKNIPNNIKKGLSHEITV